LETDPNTEMNVGPTLRWGILGCARITRRGLIPGILASRTGSLQALASRDRTTAGTWAQEFGIPRFYGSYAELLADRLIDAVYIPLPNELHRPWVVAAADAGKHVLCEKPLALEAAEARAMVDHCRSRGVLLMEAFMWRHQPRTIELGRLVAGGLLGELRLIRSSFSFPIEPGDWRLDPARGGGALWDVGCYGVSTARFFAGSEPEEVRAVAHFGPTGVDLTLAATLRFPEGVVGVIDCSFEQPFRCAYELVGTKGVIEVPDAYLPPTEASPIARLRTIGSASDADSASDLIKDLKFDPRNQYAAMVDAFADSVASGRLVDPAEDGLAQMRVLDAILAVARS
jgi:D-xylose 1-dehydrogenase (NADP+, D-xylono-1,5-lactone-forming)